MKTLLIGFDSAWSARNSGAIVGTVHYGRGRYEYIDNPSSANFDEAAQIIKKWTKDYHPDATIIMIDQPIIVKNSTKQRPVENIISSIVGKRNGGVQPANTSKTTIFGPEAPIWSFLKHFQGPSDPTDSSSKCRVFETYPVLSIISLNWAMKDSKYREKQRLPKYNPKNKNYATEDWQHICSKTAESLKMYLPKLTDWVNGVNQNAVLAKPKKETQDKLDACICLLIAIKLIEGENLLMIGNMDNGFMVVPYSEELDLELRTRCEHIPCKTELHKFRAN